MDKRKRTLAIRLTGATVSASFRDACTRCGRPRHVRKAETNQGFIYLCRTSHSGVEFEQSQSKEESSCTDSSAQPQPRTRATGTVWKIEASIGSQVAADEPVMVVESMKMKFAVAGASAGRLLELLVEEGDAVTEGQTVAVLES